MSTILQSLRQRLITYAQLVRLDKPIGILLLLWPTSWGLWIAANGQPDPKVVVIFLLGTLLMRSAGCAINDYADRDFDRHVRRTKARPLAQKRITTTEALLVAAALSLLAFSLVLQTNLKTIYLSIAALGLATLYPFAKRFTQTPQLFLGMAFAWSIPMAYTAHYQAFEWSGALLFACALLWTLVYDTQYAMVDRADDLKIGIGSTAILFGKHDRLMIGVLQAAILFGLTLVGLLESLNDHFYLCLLVAGFTFIYQQYLIKNRDPQQCFKAFLNNNWTGAWVFLGFLLGQ